MAGRPLVGGENLEEALVIRRLHDAALVGGPELAPLLLRRLPPAHRTSTGRCREKRVNRLSLPHSPLAFRSSLALMLSKPSVSSSPISKTVSFFLWSARAAPHRDHLARRRAPGRSTAGGQGAGGPTSVHGARTRRPPPHLPRPQQLHQTRQISGPFSRSQTDNPSPSPAHKVSPHPLFRLRRSLVWCEKAGR